MTYGDRCVRHWVRALRPAVLVLSLTILLAGCAVRPWVLRGVADELAAQGAATEDDPLLARDAAAFYLKLSESLLREQPGHRALAESVSGGFVQYAYAFVAFEADRIEGRDAAAAQRLRERAAALYRRAWLHAMGALEHRQPGFRRDLATRGDHGVLRLADADIGLAYWAAAAWGGYIALSKDSPDIVADLPLVVRLAHIAYERAPDHGDGRLASLMGTLEASRPGGSAAQAALYFDRAAVAAAGRDAGVYVARAEALAQPAGDRRAFEALLRQAIDAAAARRDLANVVMRDRAIWLLANADDLF